MLQTLQTPTIPLPSSGAATRPRAAAAKVLPRWLKPALHSAGMGSLLDRDSGLLLLAPSDAALQAHLQAQGCAPAEWLRDPVLTRQLLLEHLVPAPELPLNVAPELALATLAGCTLWLRASGRHGLPSVSAGSGIEAAALAPEPQRCGSLRLLGVDRVLSGPQGSLLDLLATEPGHQLLLQALRISGHDAMLRASGPFTLLAPQDSGWAALAERLGLTLQALMSQPARLAAVLELHLIPGRWLSHQLPWGAGLRSAGSQVLHCSALGLIGCHCQAQPLLPGSDRQARNGVLHRLAEPLVPCTQALSG